MPEYGDLGRLTRRNIKIEAPTNNVQDVLDELYEVLLRRRYAIAQFDYKMMPLTFLCRIEDDGRFTPLVRIVQIDSAGIIALDAEIASIVTSKVIP